MYDYCSGDPHGLDRNNDGKPCNTYCYSKKTYSFEKNKEYTVERVVDGDTVVIKQQKIRILYINTPESVHPEANKNTYQGKIVSNWAKKFLKGKKIKLDCQSSLDKYQRHLCHIYFDNQNYSSIVIKRGFSVYDTDYGQSKRYHNKFTRLEAIAKKNKCGLWSDFKKVCDFK